MKRFLALLLTILIAIPSLPMSYAAAQTPEPPVRIDPQINPLYTGLIDAAELVFPEASVAAAETPEYVTEDEAAMQVREFLKARTETFTVHIQSQNTDLNALYEQLLDQAMAHTGNPTEGDYLRFQYGGSGGSASYYSDSSWYYYSITYSVVYYTTAEQEAEMDLAVEALLEQLALDGCSDYEKVCGIYDYMCANITYDYANLNNASYKLKYTGYAALLNKTAVCQGYAVLLYRLLLELGVDNRVITGIGNDGRHAWNILKLDGRYYNADSTWDATWRQAGLEYDFFLRNEENFTAGGTDHIRDPQFDTPEFHAAYPMGETDYDPTAAPPQGLLGDLDLDGDVDSDDLTLLARHVGGIELVTGQALLNADVNSDGSINSDDLTKHARYVGGIITDWDQE